MPRGQVLAHPWAVRAVVDAGAGALPVNLKLLVDAEEEIGSPQLPHHLDCPRRPLGLIPATCRPLLHARSRTNNDASILRT
jgi:acetylornithine deacetylase/succinyl-diaminopimelate desuccinylase-like protein